MKEINRKIENIEILIHPSTENDAIKQKSLN